MLALAVPVVALSPMFAMLVGYPAPTGALVFDGTGSSAPSCTSGVAARS